jgi:hypothetical protein
MKKMTNSEIIEKLKELELEIKFIKKELEFLEKQKPKESSDGSELKELITLIAPMLQNSQK